jgi:hypothetical protein
MKFKSFSENILLCEKLQCIFFQFFQIFRLGFQIKNQEIINVDHFFRLSKQKHLQDMNFEFFRALEQFSDIIGSHFQFSSVQKIQNLAHDLKFKIVNFDDFWSVFCEYFSKFRTVSCEEKKLIKFDEI